MKIKQKTYKENSLKLTLGNGEKMVVNFRGKISDYTSRVLGVIKERYGLRDKAEALDKLTEMYGENFVEKEMKEEALRDLVFTCKEHVEKYGDKNMTLEELDDLFEE